MDIRAETPADRPAVHDLVRTAFGAEGAQVAGLLDPLRADPHHLSLVADDAGTPVGHVMFTHAWLDAPRRLLGVRVLSPLAVAAGHRGRGVGRALVEHGTRLLDAAGVPLVFLEGDPAYYRRLGFEAGGELGFRKPSLRIPDAAFQVRRLGAYEGWMTGTLVYPAVFWDHDAVGLRDPGA